MGSGARGWSWSLSREIQRAQSGRVVFKTSEVSQASPPAPASVGLMATASQRAAAQGSTPREEEDGKTGSDRSGIIYVPEHPAICRGKKRARPSGDIRAARRPLLVA